LEDFQSLYKTDAEIFPPQMVKSLVDSLPESERSQVKGLTAGRSLGARVGGV